MSLTSVIRYLQALDTTATDGSGKTGLAFGDITAKYLTQGGTLTSLTTETITTLGTYQAPTSAAHVRIKELANADPTKGIYEVHFHNTQMAGSGKKLWLYCSASGARFQPLEVDLVPYLDLDGQSSLDLKDLTDTGYDPATHKVQGVVLTDTTTTATTATNVTTVNGLAAGVITDASIAADAITDAKVAANVTIASVTGAVGSVTGAVGSVTGAVGSIATGGIAASSFAAGAIDNAAIATDAIGSAELAASAVTEIQSGLSTLDAAGIRTAVGLAGATLDTQLAALQADTDNLQTRLPAALVGGRIDASVGDMATNTVTAAALATDAVTEIQSGLSTLTAAGVRTAVGLASANLDTQLGAIAGYLDTEVAAIKAKTDNLPSDPADASDIAAAFASVASTLATIAGYLDTEVAAIKAKTDTLPASPAAVGSAMTLATDALNAAALATAAAEKLADILLRRHQEDVEASGDGDTLQLNSLYGAVSVVDAQKVSTTAHAGFATVYQTDGATELGQIPLTIDAAADPITVKGS